MTKLSSHQEVIFDDLVVAIEDVIQNLLRDNDTSKYLFSLQGAAGTGKSFLTTKIVNYFKSKNIDVTLSAPTHKAAGVLYSMLSQAKLFTPCKTIHSFLGIKPVIDHNSGIESFEPDRSTKKRDSTTLLIVDESSMLSDELLNYIDEALKESRVSAVLFVGDSFQLLPVGSSSNSIYSLKNQYILSEVVRQAKDSYIIQLASKLREYIESQSFINLIDFFKLHKINESIYFYNQEEFLRDFHKNKEWFNEDKIISTYTNKSVDEFNHQLRNIYYLEKNILNPPPFLKGDKLRFKEQFSIANTPIYHNGQVVEIENANQHYHSELELTYWECQESGSNQRFKVLDMQNQKLLKLKLQEIASMAKKAFAKERVELWKLFFDYRDMFADVQYTYASTIHKLQGSTYETSYIDIDSIVKNKQMSDDEKYRLAYVAITRAKKDVKILIAT